MTASTARRRGAGRGRPKHLTLRNVPPEVMAKLAREAQRRGASQNATAVDLLRRALGVAGQPYDNGLARYAGDWSAGDFEEFTKAVAPFEQVDDELWK